jgi:hypothetical protein
LEGVAKLRPAFIDESSGAKESICSVEKFILAYSANAMISEDGE